MGWQEDREIYIQKLDRIVSGADKLLALPHNRVISVKMRDDLGKLRNEAEKLQKKLTHNEFEIAVVGVEKSGKSSFVNALIKLDTLPTSGERCTYTTTCIRSGDENSARVTFYTTQDLEKDLRNKLEILNIPDPHLYNLNNLDLDHYEQIKDPKSHKGHAQKSSTSILYHNILCLSTVNFYMLISRACNLWAYAVRFMCI